MSDRIVSHPSNDAYREGWERAFGSDVPDISDTGFVISDPGSHAVIKDLAPPFNDTIYLKGTA